MADIKCATTYDQQLAILESRGVVIEDPDQCMRVLEDVNYYRLTAYFLPYRKSDNTYKAGTSFLHVYRLYEFDRKLRLILFSALEEVEISLRSRFSYYHAHKYDATGYLDPANFNKHHNYERFRDHIQREMVEAAAPISEEAG